MEAYRKRQEKRIKKATWQRTSMLSTSTENIKGLAKGGGGWVPFVLLYDGRGVTIILIVTRWVFQNIMAFNSLKNIQKKH